MDYQQAGVDLEAAAKAVALIGRVAATATRPEVVEAVGGFAGLFRIGSGKLLAAATDGVGTKTEIARLAGRLDTVGIDLVAMCADDGVTAEDMTLMSRFILGVPASDLQRFLSRFRRLLHLYQERHPECRESTDFRRTLARQFDAVAYRTIGGTRTDVASVYGTALAEDPGLWRELSWTRALALIFFGREGRARLGQSGPARALRAIRQSHHG